jgi:hypothetical protein
LLGKFSKRPPGFLIDRAQGSFGTLGSTSFCSMSASALKKASALPAASGAHGA